MRAWKKGAVIGGIVGLLSTNFFGAILKQPDLIACTFHFFLGLKNEVFIYVIIPPLIFGLIVGAVFDIVLWEKSKLTIFMVFLSLGTYFYNLKNPWELIPYSIIALSVLWWLVISYNLVTKNQFIKTYGIASSIAFIPILSIYILIMPTMSIVLRAFFCLKQATDITFLSFAGYIFVLNGYYWIIERALRGEL